MSGMPLLLFVAFLVVPLIELAVIIQVAEVISVGPTLALLILDSLIGAWLVRREGRRTWGAFREALNAARWPGDEVVQGALVLLGGALLLTPGFVTDAVGLLAVLPPTRAVVSRLLRDRLTPAPVRAARGRSSSKATTGGVYDVEVVDIERDVPPSAPHLPPSDGEPS
jgi:UPF0716 protein FxsA